MDKSCRCSGCIHERKKLKEALLESEIKGRLKTINKIWSKLGSTSKQEFILAEANDGLRGGQMIFDGNMIYYLSNKNEKITLW